MNLAPPSTALADFVAVIPAGGVGSRLWPLSQPHRPKFLLDLLGTGTTLIQDTVDRLAPLATQTLVVTGQRHAEAVRAQLPQLAADALITEPSPRDSMAAIALAAAIIQHRHGDRVMGSFAADHVIGEPETFRATVATAVAAARKGKLVTIGIAPTEPSPAFGYIAQGGPADDAPGAFDVKEFTEKPDVETATRMLADGGYVWNAGMFVVRTTVLLGHLQGLQPSLFMGVNEIAAAWDTDQRATVVERVWPTLTKIAIDNAIAEPVAAQGGVVVVPGHFDWHDVGDFDSLIGLLSADADGVTRVGRSAPVATFQASGATVVGGTKPIAIVGIDNAVVVETDEAILVLGREASQVVKDAAAAL